MKLNMKKKPEAHNHEVHHEVKAETAPEATHHEVKPETAPEAHHEVKTETSNEVKSHEEHPHNHSTSSPIESKDVAASNEPQATEVS